MFPPRSTSPDEAPDGPSTPAPLEALAASYVAAILRAEARPENAPGADKTWVARMDDAFRRHYGDARRA